MLKKVAGQHKLVNKIEKPNFRKRKLKSWPEKIKSCKENMLNKMEKI